MCCVTAGMVSTPTAVAPDDYDFSKGVLRYWRVNGGLSGIDVGAGWGWMKAHLGLGCGPNHEPNTEHLHLPNAPSAPFSPLPFCAVAGRFFRFLITTKGGQKLVGSGSTEPWHCSSIL